MTSSYVPRGQLSGWLGSVAAVNPETYVLEGLRSLVTVGWQWDALAKAVLAIAVVGLVSMSLALATLRGRTGEAEASADCPAAAPAHAQPDECRHDGRATNEQERGQPRLGDTRAWAAQR